MEFYLRGRVQVPHLFFQFHIVHISKRKFFYIFLSLLKILGYPLNPLIVLTPQGPPPTLDGLVSEIGRSMWHFQGHVELAMEVFKYPVVHSGSPPFYCYLFITSEPSPGEVKARPLCFQRYGRGLAYEVLGGCPNGPPS
jgi:hypothetical protein